MTLLSNLESHATNRYTHCGCGGTILSGPDHVYCDSCENVVYYGDDMDIEDWDEAMDEISGADANTVNKMY